MNLARLLSSILNGFYWIGVLIFAVCLVTLCIFVPLLGSFLLVCIGAGIFIWWWDQRGVERCPDCKGRVRWNEANQDWEHENPRECFLAYRSPDTK